MPEKQSDEIRERTDAAGREILRKAEVIATTLSQCYLSSEISEQNFDVLIFDEESMAPLQMIFHAASLCRYKVVIAGDFRQLPPIGNQILIQRSCGLREIFIRFSVLKSPTS